MSTLAAAPLSNAGSGQLILAAVLGIAVVILLIAWAKWHPFLALILGSAVLGLVAAVGPADIVTSFANGLGSTVGSVGLLIALGSMIGALLAESGGADGIVHRIVNSVGGSALPWAMAGVAALIGLPLFFEVGVVLLVPIVLLVARRTDVGLLRIGIPALAGLSVLHGLVPPHPGPLVAIASLHADLGLTLLLGLICAIPTVIVAGPVFGTFIAKRVAVPVPALLERGDGVVIEEHRDAAAGEPRREAMVGEPRRAAAVGEPRRAAAVGEPRRAAAVGEPRREAMVGEPGRAVAAGEPGRDATAGGESLEHGREPVGEEDAATGGGNRAVRPRRDPGVWPAVLTVLLPIVLMLARGVAELTLDKGNGARSVLDVLGNPPVALLLGVLLAMWTLGKRAGFDRRQTSAVIGGSLPPIAGILLIVAAGGGFKQVLVDAGVGNVVADAAKHAHFNALLLGFLVAVGIRVATGSATVATITAAGIVAPLAGTLNHPSVALLALAIGCGSLFFSHVNDAGFWLVKEYFGMTVGQTVKTWSVMETIISVVGFACVMLLSLVV